MSVFRFGLVGPNCKFNLFEWNNFLKIINKKGKMVNIPLLFKFKFFF